MPDLTLTQLRQAYDAALEQIAAESILERGMSNLLFRDRLMIGNNPTNSPPGESNLDGKLRMTLAQAQAFPSRYKIIDAYQNDATGFSAVALRDTANPGRVALAVRSTEINNDRARDVGADFQIFTSGFAFDQILSAQDFLTRVQPQLLPGEKIDLVGYSLSGNVVRTMAAMYPDLINQGSGSNVVFNATGLGGFSDPTGQNRLRSVVLLEMMDLYRRVEDNPASVTDIPLTNVLLLLLQATANAAPPVDRTDANGNVYPSPRNDFAEAYVQNRYTTFYNDFGSTVAEPSFAQYFGVALSGFDAAAVANSGSHPVPIGISIEGQPAVEIPGVASKFDYLNTHSLTLIADSLRLQVLFKEIDPNLSMDAIQSIFQAASATSASTLTQTAEGDTLEKALDPLRKLFLGPTLAPLTLPSSNDPGSFGNIPNRTAFYNAIAAVKTALAGATVTIEPFVELNAQGNAVIRLAPSEVSAAAQENTDRGLAFRYALKALNPFAVIDADYQALGHASNGALTLFDPATGFGELTEQYLTDRAAFLEAKIELNLVNDQTSGDTIHYKDFVGVGYEIPTGSILTTDQEFLFGSDDLDPLTGGSKDDHLYGGGGDDVLTGLGGDDYLQGDAGNDTYIYNAGDGFDTILDTGGDGSILVDGVTLAGGAQYGDRRVHRDDNGHLYVQVADKTLLIDGRMLVNNYTPSETTGALSLNMARAVADVNPHTVFPDLVGDLAPLDGDRNALGVQLQYNSLGNVIVDPNSPEPGRADTLYDRTGNDHMISGGGDDHLYATRGGHDVLSGGAGNDLLAGDDPNDTLVVGGEDVLDGGAGADELQLERMAA